LTIPKAEEMSVLGSKKLRAKKTYFYRIWKAELKDIEDVVRRRSEIKGWQFLNEQYGFVETVEFDD
jgi:hypothetical protein